MAGDLAVGLAVVSVGAVLSAAGIVLYRFVYKPLRDDIDDAQDMAADAQQRTQELEQLLVGPDAEADEGVLVRLQQDIAELKRQTDRSNRLQTEEAHNFVQLLQWLNEREDDVEMEIEDDTIILRGDRMTDGGPLYFRHPG